MQGRITHGLYLSLGLSVALLACTVLCCAARYFRNWKKDRRERRDERSRNRREEDAALLQRAGAEQLERLPGVVQRMMERYLHPMPEAPFPLEPLHRPGARRDW
jgi:type VI protein secretion system component VasK